MFLFSVALVCDRNVFFFALSQESLETQLSKPDILTADLSKIEVRIFWEYFIVFFCCYENECHLLAAMFDGANDTQRICFAIKCRGDRVAGKHV